MSIERAPLKLERVSDVCVIRLTAEWTQSQHLDQLRRTLLELATGDDAPRVAVDVSALERINAHLLGLLVQFQHRYRAQGGQIVLAGATAQLQDLLTVTHLASILATEPTLQQALATLGAGQTERREPAQANQDEKRGGQPADAALETGLPPRPETDT